MAVLKGNPNRTLPAGLEKAGMPGVFQCELPVLWSDMDSNGHLNNGRFQSYLDEARMQAFDGAGLGVAIMRAKNQGPVIYEANLRYRIPVEHPESLTILTWLDSTNRSRGVIRQQMFRNSDDQLACDASFQGIFMDFNRGRPLNFPEHFLEAFGLK
ncbi:MAG: thioesterase family protein [Leptospiraceae bacterium]